ncbi:hypothetical protein [Plantactinospora sp. WMMB782]|uniref:hypothetical protein n=1 Tax=Plantactinospora sp. WMMB782 TaxID=3404121 RepID=UPI003B94F177
MDDNPLLVLSSADLFSESGFNDGVMPWELADWMERMGHANYFDWFPWWSWRVSLPGIVRKYLLPVIAEDVELVDVEEGNPIRAALVDGADVTGCWDGSEPAPELTPESVSVLATDVLADIVALLQSTPPEA